MYKKYYYLGILLPLISFFAQAQTGPNGVGTPSNNAYWYNASNLGNSNASSVNSWTNAGFNTDAAVQGNSSRRPIFYNTGSNVLNGQSVLVFDGVDDFLQIPDDVHINTQATYSERSITMVIKTGSDVSTLQTVFDEGGGVRGFNIYIENGNITASGWNVNSDGPGAPWAWKGVSAPVTANTTYVVSYVYDGDVAGFTGTISLFLNGTLRSTTSGLGQIYAHGGDNAIGGKKNDTYYASGSSSGDGDNFGGTVAEFIMYHKALNNAEVFIQHNSLGAKYDISLSNDQYTMDTPANGDFDHDVVGIGIGSNGQLSHAIGQNLFRLKSANGFNTNEYFYTGHNNASIASWNTIDVPDANNYQRLSREWRVSEVGYITSNRYQLDITDLPTVPSGDKLVIMVDSDGDFTSGATSYEFALLSGTLYETGKVPTVDGDYLALAVVTPAIKFVSGTPGTDESVDASVELELNYLPKVDEAISINYSTANGSAISGSDYTGTGGSTSSVTFLSTTGKGALSIPVTDDIIAESTENFQVTIGNSPNYNIVGNANVMYSIFDNDISTKIYFNTASSSGSESVTSGSIPVSISAASAIDVSVNYAVIGGDASNGTDYILNSGTMTITGGLGLTSGSIPFTVTNDVVPEEDETFTIELSFPSGGALDNPSSPVGTGILTHTYTIEDNDLPEVQFSSVSSSVSEGVGSLDVTVELDAAYFQDVDVNYSLTSGTAGTSDYVNSSGTVTISAGLTTESVTLNIKEDCLVESNENFNAVLSGPSNATLGTNSSHTVTITDNDVNGPGGVGCGLAMWYSGNDNVSTSGTAVTQWGDQSPNSHDGAQNNSTNQPQLVSNDAAFNYHNSLSFDGTSDYIYLPNSLNSQSLDKLYTFVVYKTSHSSGSSTDNWSFIDFDRSEHYNCFVHGDGRLGFAHMTGSISDVYGTTASNNNEAHIGTYIYNNTLVKETTLKLDGVVEADVDVVNTGVKIGKNSTRYGFIGDGSEATGVNGSRNNRYFAGEIAEIIVFENANITPDDLNKIESYLALKYGIHMVGTDHVGTGGVDERDYRLGNGNVIWDYSANQSYSNNITGLGRDDKTSLNQTVAKSIRSGATVKMTSSTLSDGNVIAWGHNNMSLSSVDETPGLVTVRTEKVWKVSEIGETGNLTIEIDVTGMPGMPTVADEFVLLVDADGDFSNAIAIDAASFSSNVLTFNNVNLSNGQYFSVGCWKSIVWDGASFDHGSGTGGAPNTADVARKFYVQGAGGVLTSNAIVKEIEVANSASLVINSGFSMETPGKIVNNGTITLENNASIVQTHTGASSNSGSGNYIVKRTGETNTNIYNAWGSPVQNQSIMGVNGVFEGSNPCDVYTYIGATQQWKYDYPTNYSTSCLGNAVVFSSGFVFPGSDGIIDQARGYFVPGNAIPTRQFEGEINDGDISIAVSTGPNPGAGWSGDNWNLVANPYPSGIDAADFVTANNTVISGSLYFWDQTVANNQAESDYVVWNAAGTVDQNAGSAQTYGEIGAGQGFFVEAVSNGTVSFNNSMRTSSNSTFYKMDPNEFDRIRLKAVNPLGKEVEQLIAFHDDATDGRDNMYDARYLEGSGIHHFYSVLDEEPMIIQTYKKLEVDDTKVIPLGLKTTQYGKFSFLLDQVDNFNGEIVLFDSLTMKSYDMLTNTPQVILDTAGVYNDRFYLMLKKEAIDTTDSGGTTGIAEWIENSTPIIESYEDRIVLKSGKDIESIEVYNVLGKKIYSSTSIGRVYTIPSQSTTELAIIQVKYTDGDTYQTKHLLYGN